MWGVAPLDWLVGQGRLSEEACVAGKIDDTSCL